MVVEKVVYKEVPVEVIKEVIKEVEVERIVEVPVERIVEREVIVEKLVTKEVEVEVIKEIVKEVEVPVEKIVERIVEVEVPGTERIIEIQAPLESKNSPSSALEEPESLTTTHSYSPVRLIPANTIVTTSRSLAPEMQTVLVPRNQVIRDPYHERQLPQYNKRELLSEDFHRKADDIYQSFANVRVGGSCL